MEVQDKLLEKYGVTIVEAVEDFGKLDFVLRELFGGKGREIELSIVEKIITLEDRLENEKAWITIEDAFLTTIVLEAVGDHDKKNILNTVLDDSKIISDILTLNRIPQTSGYRKVNSLIQNGMLMPQGFVSLYDGKKVAKYKSVFENIVIMMEKNKVIVRALPASEAVEKSIIMQMVASRLNYGHIRCT